MSDVREEIKESKNEVVKDKKKLKGVREQKRKSDWFRESIIRREIK